MINNIKEKMTKKIEILEYRSVKGGKETIEKHIFKNNKLVGGEIIIKPTIKSIILLISFIIFIIILIIILFLLFF